MGRGAWSLSAGWPGQLLSVSQQQVSASVRGMCSIWLGWKYSPAACCLRETGHSVARWPFS